MHILSIETSCDETAAALVESSTSPSATSPSTVSWLRLSSAECPGLSNRSGPSGSGQGGLKIISNVVASSVELHKKYGGIIPEIAAREQVKCIIPVIDEALKTARCSLPIAGDEKTTGHKLRATSQIDALAVTVGPGLIGSLLVGVETAKTLAFAWQRSIVPVNHLLAHLYAAWLDDSKWRVANSAWTNTTCHKLRATSYPEFPLIGLVASGGHTELILMLNHGNYRWLGGTRDDAAGECLDKCARLLELGYPGGPAIEVAASTISHKSSIISHLPRPMVNQENFDFSFSGLKTAVLKEVRSQKLEVGEDVRSQKLDRKNLTSKFQPQAPTSNLQPLTSNLAASIQEAITDVLVEKTIRAAKKYKVKSVIVAGGVAANKRLREKFQSAISYQLSAISLFIPPPQLCTDNATFVAACAFYNFSPVPWQKIQADAGLSL